MLHLEFSCSLISSKPELWYKPVLLFNKWDRLRQIWWWHLFACSISWNQYLSCDYWLSLRLRNYLFQIILPFFYFLKTKDTFFFLVCLKDKELDRIYRYCQVQQVQCHCIHCLFKLFAFYKHLFCSGPPLGPFGCVPLRDSSRYYHQQETIKITK